MQKEWHTATKPLQKKKKIRHYIYLIDIAAQSV
jgi:hypothetical protein